MLQSIWTILEAILFKLENNWRQIDISTVIFCLRGAAEDGENENNNVVLLSVSKYIDEG